MEVESALQQQYDDAFEREEQDAVKSIAAYSQIVQSGSNLFPHSLAVLEQSVLNFRLFVFVLSLSQLD
jgi:hypothetical protein